MNKQRKARYSLEAYRIDSKGRKTNRWRITPGIASEFIHHLPDLLAEDWKPVVLWCRVSNQKQEQQGNLDDQMNDAIQRLQKLGFKLGRNLFVFRNVGPSSIHADRLKLELAIAFARERGAILVAVHRDRFIRSSSFDGRTGTEAPTIGEYVQLRRMAGDVPLATIQHPDDPAARSNQIKRGQKSKGNCGGRPRKRKWRERRLARIDLAREMSNAGLSYRQIANRLNATGDGFCNLTHMTVCNWLKRGV